MRTEDLKKPVKKLLRADLIILFLLFVCFFYFFIYYTISDLQLHSNAVRMININRAAYPPNFLYYLILNIGSSFSKNFTVILLATCIIMAVSMTAKYEVSRIVIKEKLISEGFINPKNFKLTIIFISFCLILFFPIQDYIGAFEFRKYYYGKIVPNVWHNSTTIFLFPFAMLLFWKQYKELKSGTPVSNSSLVTLSMLVVLNILIKPSFFIVFAPITILFLYIRYKISAEFTKNLIPIFIGLFLLYFMHRVTYILQLGSYNKSEGSITFSKPFEAWTYFAPGWYLPISFVHSYALPIFYMIFYWKESVRNNKLFQFTLSMTVLGLLISILVIENGPRKFHGNFMWQNVICTYILMLIVSCDLIKKYLEEGLKSIKLRTLIIVFFLHAISGIIYIIKIFVTKSPA